MSPGMVSILAAATAIIGVLAGYQVLSDLFLRDRSRLNDRVDEEFLKSRTERAKKSPLFKNLGQVAAEAMADAGTRGTLKQRFEVMVEQAGMDVTPARIAAIAGAAAAVAGVAGFLVRGSPIDAVLGAALGAVAPAWYVKRRRDKRIEKMRSQLAEAFELMARVVRAGQTLGQAILAVAEEFPQPIAGEFALCYEQQNLGLSPELTFRDLSRRCGLIEMRIFVLAVLVQQQTGGNLAELLLKLATVVRERYQIRGAIQTLTAEGRLQGWVLAALPPLMLLLMYVINPGYVAVLFRRPNILLATFGFETLGVLWIRKIVNFEF